MIGGGARGIARARKGVNYSPRQDVDQKKSGLLGSAATRNTACSFSDPVKPRPGGGVLITGKELEKGHLTPLTW